MQHLEVSGAVRHIYIYIYVIRRLKVKRRGGCRGLLQLYPLHATPRTPSDQQIPVIRNGRKGSKTVAIKKIKGGGRELLLCCFVISEGCEGGDMEDRCVRQVTPSAS